MIRIMVQWHSNMIVLSTSSQLGNTIRKDGSSGSGRQTWTSYSFSSSRTPEEELRDKIAELERRNLDLQMENDLLKKVRELERRGRYL